MVEEVTNFPEFEKFIERNDNLISYPEDLIYSKEIPTGFVLISIGVTLFAISYSTASLAKYVGFLLILCGTILCLVAFILNRKSTREYGFRGLSRTTITKTIMYLDSFAVQIDEPESSVLSHEVSSLSSNEKSMMFKDAMKFIKQTTDLITWPLDFITETHRHSIWIKRRIIILTTSGIILSIIAGFGTCNALESGLPIFAFLGIALLCLFLVSIGCIFGGVSSYARIPILKNTIEIKSSKTQKTEETLNEILTLLQREYSKPLRFYLVREYAQLIYTGRTKKSDALVRLKEAVFYPKLAA